jgi:hypothetical protein
VLCDIAHRVCKKIMWLNNDESKFSYCFLYKNCEIWPSRIITSVCSVEVYEFCETNISFWKKFGFGCYRLFYHIVATADISSKITKEFNRSNLRGEINFFLLNHLSVKTRHYPNSKVSLSLIYLLQVKQAC